MGFFLLLLVWAVVFVVAELIRPKPDIENARPLGLGDFNFPTATEGRTVPIVWGRVMIKGPNCVWYGNLRNRAIVKEVKTGIFSSEDVITGFRYYIGLQMAICRGPVDQIHQLKINEKFVDFGTTVDGFRAGVSVPNLFGGEEHGQGGISGTVGYYLGTKTAPVNAYLQAQTGSGIAYRGTCYAVFEGGYLGTAPTVHPWIFEVSRIPDGLGMASYDPGSEVVNTWDCNPMNVIFEILTDNDWGLAIPNTQIDTTNFREVASVLAGENNGFSMVLDGEREASDILSEVTRQIDGSLYFDREVGLWRCILARDDYSPTVLDHFNEDNILELTDYSRATWQETTNQVRVLFVDRDDGYKDTFAFAQDMANNIIQDGTISVDLNYPGVKNRTLANNIAWRELSTLSFPLAKINFLVNREGFNLVPGAVFRFSWGRLGLVEIVFRLARVEYGTIEDGTIIVYAIQDIFAAGSGSFSDPPGTGWVDPNTPAIAVTSADTLVFEAPGQMVANDPANPSLNPRVWMGARDPGGGTINFQSYSKWWPSRPIPSPTPAYQQDSIINAFLLAGSLETALDAYGSSATRPATDYLIRINDADPDDLTDLVVSGSQSLVRSLINILYIDGEFVGFENMVDVGGGVYQLTNIYRGLFNSAPKDHAVNTRVWFIGQSGGNLTQIIPATLYDEVDVQLRSKDKIQEVSEVSTPVESLPTLTYTWSEPLPPRDPLLHGGYAPSSATVDTQYTSETGLSGDDARALEVEFTPRAWRVTEVLEDAQLSGSPVPYDEDNPEFDAWLTLDPDGTPIDTALFNIDWTSDQALYILRNAVIEAVGDNASIPTTARLKVLATHDPDGIAQQSAVNNMEFDFTLTSALQSADDLTFGALTKDVASAAVIFGEIGSYVVDIHTALPSSGIVEVNIDSAGWVTLIAASGTTGNIVTTAGTESIELRFNQYPANDQFFDIVGPTAELGYGVLKAL